jgi:pimeloyl-ACP methyl ester carboxylesterase
VLIAGYLLIIFAAPFTDQLFLFPTTYPIDPRGAQRKTIPVNGGELEVWTQRSRRAEEIGSPSTYVLRFYGNADRAERWTALEAEMFNGRAVELWGVNYPGFGGSSGSANLRQSAAAGLGAFDAMKSVANEKPIFIYGASIGTTIALHVAAQRSAAGMILHNPVPLRQLVLRRYGWWNAWLLAGPVALRIPKELDSITNAKRVHARAVFLLAENDELVLPRFQRLVVDAYAGKKRVVLLPGAHHNSALEGTIMTDVYNGYGWLFGPSTSP